MTLVVNLVRTVSLAKFICCCWRIPWRDCYVTHTHTPKCNESAKIRANYSLWLNNTDCLSVFLCRLRISTRLRSGAVDKMAGIFTKRIWQPYIICQPNELKREVKKKTGGPNGEPSKNLGCHGPPRPPLRIAPRCTTFLLLPAASRLFLWNTAASQFKIFFFFAFLQFCFNTLSLTHFHTSVWRSFCKVSSYSKNSFN